MILKDQALGLGLALGLAPFEEEIDGKVQIQLRVQWWGLPWLQMVLALGQVQAPIEVPFEAETGGKVQTLLQELS